MVLSLNDFACSHPLICWHFVPFVYATCTLCKITRDSWPVFSGVTQKGCIFHISFAKTVSYRTEVIVINLIQFLHLYFNLIFLIFHVQLAYYNYGNVSTSSRQVVG